MHVAAKRTTYFNTKVAYKINALGLPERVARYNGYLPADLSYADFMNDKYYFGARYFDPFLGLWLSPDVHFLDEHSCLFDIDLVGFEKFS